MDTVRSQKNLSFAVKNPATFVGYAGNWTTQDTSTSYMWNDKNIVKDSDGKSFFDPSPIGWRLPIWGVWSDFSANATKISDNVGTYTPASATFYALGYRDRSSSALSGASSTSYWSSTSSAITVARYLYFTTGSVSITGTYSRACGYAIRAIRE